MERKWKKYIVRFEQYCIFSSHTVCTIVFSFGGGVVNSNAAVRRTKYGNASVFLMCFLSKFLCFPPLL